jgi:hypothetical protein
MRQNLRPTLRPADRTLTRCLVCGCSEVRTDEVVDLGWVFLHECPRCDHRWPRRAASSEASVARPVLRVARDVASAA